jgi:hypothetical protein
MGKNYGDLQKYKLFRNFAVNYINETGNDRTLKNGVVFTKCNPSSKFWRGSTDM